MDSEDKAALGMTITIAVGICTVLGLSLFLGGAAIRNSEKEQTTQMQMQIDAEKQKMNDCLDAGGTWLTGDCLVFNGN